MANQSEGKRFFDIMKFLGMDDSQAIKVFYFLEGEGSLEEAIPELKGKLKEEEK